MCLRMNYKVPLQICMCKLRACLDDYKGVEVKTKIPTEGIVLLIPLSKWMKKVDFRTTTETEEGKRP